MKLAQILAQRNFDTTKILGKNCFSIDLKTFLKRIFSICQVKYGFVIEHMIYGLVADYAFETHWMDTAKQMSITRSLSTCCSGSRRF
jgi:hypothetical protein